MREILLAIVILLITSNLSAQVQQAWVARANGVENKDEFGGLIARDAAGFIYVAGSRDGTADEEDEGFLTIKYNPLTGAVIWAHINNGAGNGNAGPSDMCVDAAGNVYVTGGGGPTSHGEEWFTIKYNTSGTQIWEDAYTNSANGESAAAIAVDGSGNVFVTGHSYTDGGVSSITTIKYDAAGNRIWIRYYNGDDDEGGSAGRDIAVDATGNVYVTGYASYSGTDHDLVILKYDNNGTQLSSNRYDGPNNDEPFSMVLDAAANIYITGRSVILNHESDVLTLKYNSNCNIIWERLFNGSISKGDVPHEIAIDATGNVFVAGFTTINTAGTDRDYLLIKYDPSGNKLWEAVYGKTAGINDGANGLAIDDLGNVYVTGFSGNLGGDSAPVDYVTIKYNTNGVQQWLMVYDFDGNSDDANDILSDPNGNIYVTGTSFRTSTNDDIATVKYTQCGLVCPSDITVNNDPGKCDAVITFADATTTGDCGSEITYSHQSGDPYPIGTTIVTVTSTATGATCSFNITVVDNEKPVITSCPSGKIVNTDPGVCYATAATVNAGEASATDNCNPVGVTGIRSDGASLGANYSVGNTTILWTATDASNNTTTCAQTITVIDNVPPTISGESASTFVLSPPNHTMRDVTINYTATDNCAVTSTLSVTSNEPVNGVADGDTDPDWIIVDNYHVQLRAERSAQGNGRIYTVTISATDPSGNISTKTIEIRVPHDIKKPHSGQTFKVGSTVSVLGEFWDKPGNKHTAKWLIDETTSAKASVTEPDGNKNGTVTGSYKFNTPGVYKLQMNVTDQNGMTHFSNTAGDLEAIVVIYDPNGGHTYGGGYFNSPAGALISDPIATGKASYGFAMNYFKNSTYPKGETQFEFKVGDFEFNALNFDYLVINSSMAQFKGTGKIIGGQSGVGFTMTIVDGQLDGTGIDKIRMKIYNKNNGTIIYDNQPNASDAALPTQAVGANSTIVISGTNSSITKSNTTNQNVAMEASDQKTINDLNVIVYPNPSNHHFSITVQTVAKEKIMMHVVDMYGRVVEVRNITANSVTRFGDRYNPGTYFVRVINGKEHKEIKLVKLSD
jgi:hypothetical protein